jgi:hypothetical protein
MSSVADFPTEFVNQPMIGRHRRVLKTAMAFGS